MSYLRSLKGPTFINHATGRKKPNDTGWQDRHVEALYRPRGFEAAIVGALEAWARYADEHRARYESGVGEDGFIGPEWANMGRAIRALLNGETGRLGCGTLDGFIVDTLASEGFDA